MRKGFTMLVFVALITLIIGAVLILVFPQSPYKKAIKLYSQGDSYIQEGLTEGALKSYEQAEDKWFLYKIDPRFQQKKRKVEEEVKKKVAVTILLKDEAIDSEIQSFIQEIKSIKGVREVKLISKEEALKIVQERNKDEPLLTNFVTKDILPITIEVYLDDLKVKNEVVTLAENSSLVDNY